MRGYGALLAAIVTVTTIGYFVSTQVVPTGVERIVTPPPQVLTQLTAPPQRSNIKFVEEATGRPRRPSLAQLQGEDDEATPGKSAFPLSVPQALPLGSLNSLGHMAETNCNGLQEPLHALMRLLAKAGHTEGADVPRFDDAFRHYPSMVLYLDALRMGSSQFPQHQSCWHHWWHIFSGRVAETILSRFQRFGGPKTDGQIYIAAGFNEYVGQYQRGGHWRKGWYPQEHVRTVAKQHAVNFTMYFVSYFDEDIYLVTKGDMHRRQQLRAFLQDFPNFFFLHYSPSMVMPPGQGSSELGANDPFHVDRASRGLYGTMFPRMVPIPHAPTDRESIYALMNRRDAWPPKPFREREHLVAWRGATTGLERPYSNSDRSRVVSQFAKNRRPKYSWADVAFSGVCQGVTQGELPLFTGRMEVAKLMQYQVQLDIDGNTNSWDGLRWRLMFGMAVVKARSSKGFTQWYYRHLRNGTHIIEAPVDNVAEASRRLLEDTDLAERISINAREFGERHLSYPALDRAVSEAVRDAWRIGYDDQTKWCISPC